MDRMRPKGRMKVRFYGSSMTPCGISLNPVCPRMDKRLRRYLRRVGEPIPPDHAIVALWGDDAVLFLLDVPDKARQEFARNGEAVTHMDPWEFCAMMGYDAAEAQAWVPHKYTPRKKA